MKFFVFNSILIHTNFIIVKINIIYIIVLTTQIILLISSLLFRDLFVFWLVSSLSQIFLMHRKLKVILRYYLICLDLVG